MPVGYSTMVLAHVIIACLAHRFVSMGVYLHGQVHWIHCAEARIMVLSELLRGSTGGALQLVRDGSKKTSFHFGT